MAEHSKYIVVDIMGGCEVAIVFDNLIGHNEIGNNFKTILSAGFCSIQKGSAQVWGRSQSLNKDSRSEDEAIIVKSLFPNL